MVGIQIVAALSREAAEVRHRSAVIVGGGYFQLVHIQGENASLGIKQRIGIDLVEAVNRGSGVIAARADAAGIHHTLSHIEIRCGNLLGFLLLFFAVLSGGGIGLGVQCVVHCVQNGFTGNGGAGNYIHIGGVGFHNLSRKLCGCLIADAGGFIGGIYFYIGDLVPFPGHSDSHVPPKPLAVPVRVSELEQPARLVSSAATISADTIRFIPSLSLSVGVSVVFPCAAS